MPILEMPSWRQLLKALETDKRMSFFRRGSALADPFSGRSFLGFSRRGKGLKPKRVHNFGTYFVTSQCWGRRSLFHVDELAELFLHVLYEYAAQRRYRLHEFVVMPNHIHLIITPVQIAIERAMQLIKGRYSYAVGQTGRTALEIWQDGFTDRRLRNYAEYCERRHYIFQNPVRAHLCERPEQYPYSSANPMFKLDPLPQRLKPARLEREWLG